MRAINLKEQILVWKDKVGYETAFLKLCKTGLNPSMITKLLAGSYRYQPKEIAAKKIKEAMEK